MSLPESSKVSLRGLGAVYILNAVLRDPQCKEKFRSLNRKPVHISCPIWLSITPLGLQLPHGGREGRGEREWQIETDREKTGGIV